MTGLISPTFVGNTNKFPMDASEIDQISRQNSQGRNNSKRPFMTLQARPKNQSGLNQTQLSPQEMNDNRKEGEQSLINDYCAANIQVFTPNQAMQTQYL